MLSTNHPYHGASRTRSLQRSTARARFHILVASAEEPPTMESMFSNACRLIKDPHATDIGHPQDLPPSHIVFIIAQDFLYFHTH